VGVVGLRLGQAQERAFDAFQRAGLNSGPHRVEAGLKDRGTLRPAQFPEQRRRTFGRSRAQRQALPPIEIIELTHASPSVRN
jgi:hypothetical protein